jgi:hypothetical protein
VGGGEWSVLFLSQYIKWGNGTSGVTNIHLIYTFSLFLYTKVKTTLHPQPSSTCTCVTNETNKVSRDMGYYHFQ